MVKRIHRAKRQSPTVAVIPEFCRDIRSSVGPVQGLALFRSVAGVRDGRVQSIGLTANMMDENGSVGSAGAAPFVIVVVSCPVEIEFGDRLAATVSGRAGRDSGSVGKEGREAHSV